MSGDEKNGVDLGAAEFGDEALDALLSRIASEPLDRERPVPVRVTVRDRDGLALGERQTEELVCHRPCRGLEFGVEDYTVVEICPAVFEAEDLKTDISVSEVILGMGEDVVVILEDAYDVHLGVGFCKSLEQNCQAFTAFMCLRVMLDVLVFVDDGDRFRVAGLDAFQ